MYELRILCVVHTLCSERKKSKCIWLAMKMQFSLWMLLIWNSETSPLVCTQKPVGVTEAEVFLVNTNKLRHQEDIRADDVGS